MPPANFPKLQTERLLLKQLEIEDWETISFLRTDADVNKYVNRSNAATKEKAVEFILKTQFNFENLIAYYWKIVPKNENKMIGSICLWNFSEDRNQAEVGYDLHPSFQGKGMMQEALKAIVQFGFDTLNLQRVEAYTHGKNEPSINLLTRNGFELIEGKKDGDNEHNIVFVITKEKEFQ